MIDLVDLSEVQTCTTATTKNRTIQSLSSDFAPLRVLYMSVSWQRDGRIGPTRIWITQIAPEREPMFNSREQLQLIWLLVVNQDIDRFVTRFCAEGMVDLSTR